MDFEIRSWLLDAVIKAMPLAELMERLAVRTWDLVPGDEGHEVAAAAKLRLAEYTNGHLSESELLDALRSVATRVRAPSVGSTGTSEVTRRPLGTIITTS